MLELVAVLIVALLGGGGTGFLIARRRESGTIAVSEATQIWREGAELREILTRRITELEDDLQAERAGRAADGQRNQQLRHDLRGELSTLAAQKHLVELELARLKKRMNDVANGG